MLHCKHCCVCRWSRINNILCFCFLWQNVPMETRWTPVKTCSPWRVSPDHTNCNLQGGLGCKLKPASPRGGLTSTQLLSTLALICACGCISMCVSRCSSLLTPWAYWVMIVQQHPVTEDVSSLSDVQAPAESTVSWQWTTHSNTHACMPWMLASFVCLCRKAMQWKWKAKYTKSYSAPFLVIMESYCDGKWVVLITSTAYPGRWHLSFWMLLSSADGPYITVTHCSS